MPCPQLLLVADAGEHQQLRVLKVPPLNTTSRGRRSWAAAPVDCAPR